jgi:hypothetical protein
VLKPSCFRASLLSSYDRQEGEPGPYAVVRS